MATALIVDDESPMREQLRKRLQSCWPELQIVAEASNGIDAVTLADQHNPDIVFLDIRMPGKSGIEAAKLLYSRFHIVFVTAYDQYAMQAFDQGAIDYLLKPVDVERLQRTCDRLRSRLQEQPEDLTSLLSKLMQGQHAKAPEYLRWIQASVGSSIRMIATGEILYFQSDEKYTKVQTQQTEVLIRKPLKELVDELDPKEFWRIHRSTVVRVDAIVEVTRDFRGRQMLKLRNHGTLLEVSRNHAHLFQQM
jgi:DNA-binding LytR/AlgR family response regulator